MLKTHFSHFLRCSPDTIQIKCTLNVVTFYVYNLPPDCTSHGLWKALERHGNIVDSYVAKRRDSMKSYFGFVRFKEVKDVRLLEVKIANTRMGNLVIGVNMAKYDAASKSEKGHMKPTRVGSEARAIMKEDEFRSEDKPVGTHSYKDALEGRISYVASVLVPPVETEAMKIFKGDSLVAKARNAVCLSKFKKELGKINNFNEIVRYLGGLNLLITFASPIQAKVFMEERKESWSELFSELYV
jgi:RNA recognition motif-containing protein